MKIRQITNKKYKYIFIIIRIIVEMKYEMNENYITKRYWIKSYIIILKEKKIDVMKKHLEYVYIIWFMGYCIVVVYSIYKNKKLNETFFVRGTCVVICIMYLLLVYGVDFPVFLRPFSILAIYI